MLKALMAGLVAVGLGLVATAAPGHTMVLLAAAVVLLVVSLVVAAADPRQAGVLVICVLVPASTATGVTAVGHISVAEIIPSAILAVTFLPGVVRPGWSRADTSRWALVLLLALVLGGWVATMTGGGSVIPIAAFSLDTVPMVLAVMRLDFTVKEAHWVIAGLVIGILLSTMLGIIGLRAPSGRALGFAHHSNQFANQITMATPLLWLLWRRGRVPTVLAAGALLVLLGGILQSGSRSGVLALSVVVLIWAWRRFGVVALVSAGVAVGCLVALGAFPSLNTPTTSRLTESNLTAHSNSLRETLMKAGLDRVSSDPILGSGLVRTNLPHNIFLLVWGGMGLVGLIALLVLLWRVGMTALLTPTTHDRWILSLSLIGFFTAVSVNNSLGTPAAWLLIALLQSSYLRRPEGRIGPRTTLQSPEPVPDPGDRRLQPAR